MLSGGTASLVEMLFLIITFGYSGVWLSLNWNHCAILPKHTGFQYTRHQRRTRFSVSASDQIRMTPATTN